MLALAQTANTADTMSAEQGMALFAGFGILIVVMLLIALVTFVFSIWMIVDAFNRKEEDFASLGKTAWIIILGAGIFLGYGLIASVIYFLVIKRKSGKTTETSSPK
ncbi:MAG: hypothetical protein Q7S53_03125 [bacterium]|nr:hypothetical protein [bacterium]